VKVSVSFNERWDETTQLCAYNLPTHHYLESWGDAEPKAGILAFQQPTIYPLFKTRPYQTSLLKWSGNNTDYDTYLKNYWVARLGSDDAYEKALQDGIMEVAPTGTGGGFNGATVSAAASAIAAGKKGGKTEVVLYQKVSIGTGTGATNPWLQELPDPISKASWDNYAMISMAKAKELGVKLDMDYEYYPQKPVFEFAVGNKKVELPVLVIPGMNADTIAIALGYGRGEKLGKTAANVGKDVYPFSMFNGTTIEYYAPDVTITDKNRKEKIAQSQIHNSYEGRIEVVRETTLATFLKNPEAIPEYRQGSHPLPGPVHAQPRTEMGHVYRYECLLWMWRLYSCLSPGK
jgi:molybdopterin-containing oxidoreductase family iron-sulfur binding subunit